MVNWKTPFRYGLEEKPHMIKICTTLDDGVEICTTVDTPSPVASGAYTQIVGDGTATSFTLEHGLDSLDLVPIVRGVASGNLTATDPTVVAVDPDTATVTFGAAPTVGQFQVTLLAVKTPEETPSE